MDLLRYPLGDGAVEKWEAYLMRTRVSHWSFHERMRPRLRAEHDLRA